MKAILTNIFLFITAISFSQSPIIVDVDDIADIDQEFLIGVSGPLTGFDGTSTGPDFNWDFGSLTAATQDTSVWVDVNDTDPFYFFLWLGSDIAQKTGADIENDFITIEDVFNFYTRDNDEFSLNAFAGKIADIPFPISYDDPEIILTFPAEYAQTTNSETGFEIEIPGLATWKEHRSRTNEIDGWGTITTPAGEFEVLRLRSEINIIDTFIYDVITIPIEYTSIEYRWIAKENGIPVLQINSIETFGVETTTQVIYKEGDVIDNISSEINSFSNLQIMGNPVLNNNLYFEINSPFTGVHSVAVTDILGRPLLSNTIYLNDRGQQNFLDVSILPSGTYLMMLLQNNITISSIPFIKQ